MSAVDERVVRMEFDNKRFESNIKESIKSLDDLDKQLGTLENNDSFDKIDKSARKIDFSHLLSGLGSISEGFNALEAIALGALTRIGSKITDLVTQYAGFFTIKQISAGWQKFADYSSATQATMAAISDTWEEQVDDLLRINYLTEELGDKQTAKNLNNVFKEYQKGTVTLQDLSTQLNIAKDDLNAIFNEISGIQNTTISQEEFVENAVKQLNWYSDETSYNFTDMVSTLGKFTQVGNGLVDSADAIQGMMNMVAVAGGNAQKGVRAAEQFSQAMSAGYLKTDDWRPLKNMNVATLQFKEKLIEIAVAMGTLTEVTDEYGKTVYQTADETIFSAIQGFDQSLKDGWATSEVLLKTFEEYGKFSTELYNVTEKYGVTATETLDYIDKYYDALANGGDQEKIKAINEELVEQFEGDEEAVKSFKEELERLGSESYRFSREAFKEAQSAKTFKDAIDATADAVSTKWMNIFQYMFGSSERAKKFWSNFCETLYMIFADPLDEVLKIFEKVSKSVAAIDEETGESVDAFELFRRSLDNVQEALLKIISPFREAFSEVFLSNAVDMINKLSVGFNIFTDNLIISDEAAEKIKNALVKLLTIVKNLFKFIGNLLSVIKPISGLISPIIRLVGTLASKIVDLVSAFADVFDLNIGSATEKAAKVVGDAVEWITEKLDALTEWIDKNIDYEHMVQILTDVKDAFVKAWTKIKEIASDVWDFISPYIPSFEDIKASLVAIWDTVKGFLPTWEEVVDALRAGWELFKQVADVIWKFLKPYVEQVGEAFKKFWGSFSGFITGFINADDKIGYIKDHIFGLVEAFIEWKRNSKFIRWIIDRFEDLKKVVTDIIDKFKSEDGSFDKSKFLGLAYLVVNIAALWMIFKNVSTIATGFKNISEAVKKFSGVLNKVVIFVGIYLIVKAITSLIEALTTFSQLPFTDILKGVLSVLVLGEALVLFALEIKRITSKMSESEVKNFKKVTLMMALALIAVTASLWVISKSDGDGIIIKVLALVILLASVVAAIIVLSKYVKEVKANTLLSLVIIAGVLLAGAFAIQKLGELDPDQFERAKTLILIIGGIAIAAMVVGSLLKNGSEALKNVAIAVGIMAASLLAIVISLKLLQNVKIDLGIVGLIVSILLILGILAAIPVYMAKFAKNNLMTTKDMTKMAGVIVTMSASLLIITAAIGLLAKTMSKNGIDSGEMMALAGTMGILMLGLGAMAVLLGYATRIATDKGSNANTMQKTAKAISSMVAAIVIIAAAMVVLVKMDIGWKEAWEPITILTAIMLLLGGLIVAVGWAGKIAGEHQIKTGAIVAVVLGIVTLVAALLVINHALQNEGNKVLASLGVITALMVELALLFLAIGKANQIGDGLDWKSILAVLGGLALIMRSLIAVTIATDTNDLLMASVSIGIVVAIISLMFVSIGAMEKMSKGTNALGTIGKVLAIAVAIFSAAMAFYLLKDIDTDALIAAGVAITAVMVVFGILAAVMGTIGAVAAVGILAVSAAVLIVAAAFLVVAVAANVAAEALPLLAAGVVLLGDAIESISATPEQINILCVALLALGTVGVLAMIGISVAALALAAAFLAGAVALTMVSGILPELSTGIMLLATTLYALNPIAWEAVACAGKLLIMFLELAIGGILLGVGLAAAGAGLLVVAAAALVIAVAIVIAVSAVTALVESLALLAQGVALVVDVFNGGDLSSKVTSFSDSILNSTPRIAGAISDLKNSLASEGDFDLTSLLGLGDVGSLDISSLKDKVLGSFGGEGGLFGGDFSSMLSGDLLGGLTGGIEGLDLTSLTDAFSGKMDASFLGGIEGLDTSALTSAFSDKMGIGLGDVDYSALVSANMGESLTGFDYGSVFQSAGLSTGIQTGIETNAEAVNTDQASSTIVTNFADGMVTQGNMDKVKTSGTTVGNAAVEGMNDVAPSANLAGVSIGSEGASGAGSTYWDFWSSGSSAGSGFVDGIYNNLSGASSAGIALARQAYNAAMNYLDINSPSKLFMEVGGSVVEGFAVGIHDETSYAVDSIKDMAMSTVGSATAILASAIDGEYTNPVIRPTLDLSEVAAGASQIGSMLGGHSVGVNGRYGPSANSDIYGGANSESVVNNFTINATPNQSVNDIATAVEKRLNMMYKQRKAAGVS